jgi:hypothetical protein
MSLTCVNQSRIQAKTGEIVALRHVGITSVSRRCVIGRETGIDRVEGDFGCIAMFRFSEEALP